MNRLLLVSGGLLSVVPNVAFAAVTFNEIAWMGTDVSANDEWIELYNDGDSIDVTDWTISDGQNFSITLVGEIKAGEYAVLERTDDESAPGTAFMIYTGSLSNSGATLSLRDATGALQDQVAGGENWENIGGDNTTKETAQYTSDGWITAEATSGAPNAMKDTSVAATAEDDEGEESDDASVTTTRNTATSKKKTATKLELQDKTLTFSLSAPTQVYVNQPLEFSVEPSGIGTRLMKSLSYNWNFGDFNQAVGQTVTHAYQYPGTYVIHVTGAYARHEAMLRHEITVLPVDFSLTRTRSGDIQIHNDAKYEVDLSAYQLMAREMITMPAHTILLPGGTITIPHGAVGAEAGDLIALSDVEGNLLATHGRSPLVSNTLAVAPPAGTPQVLGVATEISAPLIIPANTVNSEPAIISRPAVSTKTATSAPAASTPALHTNTFSPESPDPTSNLAYFGLAGLLALGFVGVFAGRLRTG